VSEPCFFTLRGRHRWGPSLHLGITTRQYSALLLACDLVSTSKATNGASSVSCSETVWREEFLKRYGLFVDTKGHCEITRGRVQYKYLEDDDGRSMRPMMKIADIMHLLRIVLAAAATTTTTALTAAATTTVTKERSRVSFETKVVLLIRRYLTYSCLKNIFLKNTLIPERLSKRCCCGPSRYVTIMNLPRAHRDTYRYGPWKQMAYSPTIR